MLSYVLGKYPDVQVTDLRLFVGPRRTSARSIPRLMATPSLRSFVFGSVFGSVFGVTAVYCLLASGKPPFAEAASSNLAAGFHLVASQDGDTTRCYSLPQSSRADSVVAYRR